MNATLHKNACATESERLFDLFVDDVIRKHVGFGIALHAVERAKRAELLTHIRVVDVAVDDVANDVIRMPALADTVRSIRHIQKAGLLEQEDCFLRSDAHSI